MNSRLILTFLAMGIGILAVTVDITSINVALPAIEKAFNIDLKTIEWIINGYLLSFAVLMVTCGRLADMYGRKKIFLIGLCSMTLFAQENKPQNANYHGTITSMEYVTSLASRSHDLIPSDNSVKEA